MGVYIEPADLSKAIPTVTDEDRLAEMIADAEAFAVAEAPGIAAAWFLAIPAKMEIVKAVLRSAITYDAQVAEPFTETNENPAPRSSVLLSRAQADLLRRISTSEVALSGAYSMGLGVPDTLPRY